MRVLLTEADRHTSRDAERILRDAGHEVVRCHDPDGPDFPCNALLPGKTCPLDEPGGVDVMVAWRAHAHHEPLRRETGVVCAVRRGVPLVVAGNITANPYGRWTAATSDGSDLAAVCEGAVRPTGDLSTVASRMATQVLDLRGLPSTDVGAEVWRDGDNLRALVTIPEAAAEYVDSVAVRVAGVLRAQDADASSIDVAVKPASPPDDQQSAEAGHPDHTYSVPWAIG